MTRAITILAAVAFAMSGAVASAQTSGQADTQAGASAGVQANRTSAQAGGSASAGGNASAQHGEQQGSLAAGTAVNAAFNQSLDSKKLKAGDSVIAHTTEAVKADGKTVLPKGTKLVGHVTRASARAKGDAESALAVQFDHAILKNGQEMPLQGTIQALAVAQGATQGAAAVGGDDLQGMGNAGTGAYGGASGGAGRREAGALGGVAGTVGGAASGATSTVPRVAEGATGAANSTVNSTVNGTAGAATRGATGGLNSAGQLTSTSRGVFGLNGLALDSSASNATQGSLITSAGKNVFLENGTRMLVVTQADGSASAQK